MGAGYKDLPPFVVNYGITGCFNDLRTRYSKSGGNTQTRDAAAILRLLRPEFSFCLFVTVSKSVLVGGKENILCTHFQRRKALFRKAYERSKV